MGHYRVLPVELHNEIVSGAYQVRGYTKYEADTAAMWCAKAMWYGIRTHNALKALHLDELFGSKSGGCVPGAKIEKNASRFKAVESWNANYKLGQVVAQEAIDTAMSLADQYGVGVVAIDNAFHYLWGGGYVMEAAKKGYIAYTNCTSTLAEVVPFQGSTPTLGTNPHSWAFPTQDIIGFPICIDWATSAIAMGRVHQLHREGKELPQGAAVDKQGKPTTDPEQVAALLPFGAHKGYGLSLINELTSAYVGGGIPTLRGHFPSDSAEPKRGAVFYFSITHPEAIVGGYLNTASKQANNVKRVLNDILKEGNEKCLLPGQLEAEAATKSEKACGLLLTAAELDEFAALASEAGVVLSKESLQEWTD